MKKAISILIGVVIAAIFFSIGILYARVWDPLWNPFRPPPERVLAEMAKKMNLIKTLHSEIDFGIVAKNEEKFEVGLKFLTGFDNTDPKNKKSKSTFNLSLAFDGTSFSFGGEGIVIGETSFIKLTKIPAIPESWLKDVEINFAGLKNRWIKIDRESMMEWLKEMTKEELPAEMEGIFEKSIEKQKEAEEKMKKIIEEKLKIEKIFLVKKELPDEKIGNKKVYHYLIALNRDELKKLLLKMTRIYIDTMFETMIEDLPEPFKPSPEEIEKEKREAIEELEKDLNEIFDKMGEIVAQVFVGKKDLLLYKVKAGKEIDMARLSEGKEKGIISMKTEINLSKLGEAVEIKEPEEFKKIGEIFEEILGPAIRKAQSRARDARRMADLRMIQTAMEMYYGDKEKYFVSKTMPEKIEPYLLKVPKDPGSGPCPDYQWISNLKNPQKFCLFACLENGKFYALSHNGVKELEYPPKTLDCW